MASQKFDSDSTYEPVPTMPVPSQSWCKWQALKGTNFRRLAIPSVDLRNKWIIITGGNSGIGREAALQFVKWGANIVLGCRQPPPHETHPDIVVKTLKDAALTAGHQNTSIEWWDCDMGSLTSVESFAKRWISQNQPLDILANNAGIGGVPGGEPGEVRYTIDGFELVHQVNFISHVLLTMMLLPSLAQAAQPRILCTTSCMQYFGTFDLANANSGRNAYSNNKLYFQAWLTELQARMSKSAKYKHVVIHGVHPGYVKTNIWGPPEHSKQQSGLKWGLHVLLAYVGIDAQQGSLAITYAATAPEFGSQRRLSKTDDKAFGSGARYVNRIWDENPMPQARDPDCRRQIWKFVNKELRLEEKGLLTELGV